MNIWLLKFLDFFEIFEEGESEVLGMRLIVWLQIVLEIIKDVLSFVF